MTNGNPDLADDMMRLVQRMAEMVIRRPPEEREAEYEAIRDIAHRAAAAAEMNEPAAREAGAQTEAATRHLVKALLIGGIPQGDRC